MSSFAPTSTPRVGSSQMSSRAERTSHRARIPFCCVPPLNVFIGCSTPKIRIPRRDASARAASFSLRSFKTENCENIGRLASEMFAATDMSGHETLRLAVLRQKSHAEPDRVARRLEAHRLSFESGRSTGRRSGAGEKTDQFRLSAADQPRNPEHLALVNVDIDILDLTLLRQSFGAEKNAVRPPRSETRAALAADCGLRERAFEAFAHHRRHDVGRTAVGYGEIGGVAAIAQHRHMVAQGIELFHAMRNVEQRNAVIGELAQHLEQAFHVGLRQGRGRLVEQDQTSALAQSFGQLDRLLFGD